MLIQYTVAKVCATNKNMSEPIQKKDAPEKERESTNNSTADDPPATGLSLEEALLACMPDSPSPPVAAAVAAASCPDEQANTNLDCNNVVTTSRLQVGEKEDLGDVVVPHTTLVRNATQLEVAVLACMPGAYEISGAGAPLLTNTTTTTGTSDDYVDPLDPLHVMLHGDDDDDDRPPPISSFDIELEEEQLQPAETNIVSAYRVTEEEPIIATPFRDNRYRLLCYAFLVTAAVALLVGLSVGLTDRKKAQQANDPAVDRLVSSIRFSADEEGSFVKADRYHRTEDGDEIVVTTGNGVLNRCEVLPCNEGGCDLLSYGKVYKPGCCRGEDCDRGDKCGYLCPDRRNLCQPSYVGCRDASCFECERGPDGEELYQYRSTSINVNCLRTGVALGFNDRDDPIERIYKWVIGCGYIVRGGSEWANLAPGEYACVAVRSGEGITKTLSQPVPCQLIQLGECGCAPADMNTFGLPLPDEPCRTKEDCPYLCGDAGVEQAETLCEAFPGIEWWEGENPLYQDLFTDPEELLFGNVTIEIDIFGE